MIARPSSRAVEILSVEPSVSRVIEFDIHMHAGWRERWRAQLELRKALVAAGIERILIFSTRIRYAAIALLAGVPRRSGFGFSLGQRLLLNEPPFIDPYEGDGNWVYPEATAFAIAHGLVSGPVVPRMALPQHLVTTHETAIAHLPRPLFGIVIGGSDPRRNWGAERFAGLLAELTDRGCGALVVGGPPEQAIADRIGQRLSPHARRHTEFAVQSSVLKSAALLRQCDFCVGNDTGALNIAAALEVPSLGLFGVSPPLRHDPILHAVTGQGMEAISVARVMERLAELDAFQIRVSPRRRALELSTSAPES